MKNKKILKIILAITTAVSFFSGAAIAVNAESSISSKGIFEFASGKAVFYAEDVEYLQNEINQLFSEISN